MAREDLNDGNVYDPNVVYAQGSKDAQGHSTNIRAHIPDPWVGAIAEFVHSVDWPEYTTLQHFYRDAIYHRLRWAANQPNRNTSPRVQALVAIAQGDAALEHANLLRQSSQSHVDKARKILSDLLGDRNDVAVRETLKELESTLDHIQEPWRSELKRELNNAERQMSGF